MRMYVTTNLHGIYEIDLNSTSTALLFYVFLSMSVYEFLIMMFMSVGHLCSRMSDIEEIDVPVSLAIGHPTNKITHLYVPSKPLR